MPTRPAAGGLHLTEVGLGTAPIGNLYRAVTDEAAAATVDAAWDAGVRHFDTAPHYGLGLAERRLGAALAGRPRDGYAVSTKVGRLLDPSPGTAHLPDAEGFAVPAASTTGAAALVELRDQGVVRAVGVGMNRSAMLAEFVRRCDLDLVMLAGRLTVLDQTALTDLVPALAGRRTRIVAAGVYNSGIAAADRVPDAARFDYAPAALPVLARARAVAGVAARHGLTLPQLAVRFALEVPVVASVVLGAGSPGHVRSGAERAAATVPASVWDELVASGLLPSRPGDVGRRVA